ncbi:MAG: hypothetical protein CTY19_01485 [Methylomonas sp.]|nr:MAG: hypothetical protein CTY19_01485 [Methylomonas sp.]
MKQTMKNLATAAALTMAATSAQAALSVPAGNSLVVNSSGMNLAWTRDANLFLTQANSYSGGAAAFVTTVINTSGGTISDLPNSLDTPANSGSYNLSASDFNTSTGNMNFWGAKAWVNYLNSISYAGETDWRLPNVTPVNGSSFNHNVSFNGTTDRGFNVNILNPTASELAYLFSNELGNLSAFNISGVAQAGSGLVNSGPFENFQNGGYWTGTEFQFPTTTTDFQHAWLFSNANGAQGTSPKDDNSRFYAIAVRDGQLATVPVPGSVWLMGSAIAGLMGLNRKRVTTLRMG